MINILIIAAIILVIIPSIIIIFSSFIGLALRLTSNEKFKGKSFILPSFLLLLTFIGILVNSYFIVDTYSDDGFLNTMMLFIFKTVDISIIFSSVLIPIIITVLFVVVINSALLMTVNIDYTKLENYISKLKNKIKSSIRLLINKIMKKEITEVKQTQNTEISSETQSVPTVFEHKPKLKVYQSILANIFMLSLVIFSSAALFGIGYVLAGNVIIDMLSSVL